MSSRENAGGPLVFTHVPRTAGTSVEEALKGVLEPEVAFKGFGRAVLGSYTDMDAVHPGIRQAIAFDPTDLPADAEFVAGHIPPSTTRARFPEADHFTILREPRVRLLSLWLFARAHTDFNLRHWREVADWMRSARSSLCDYISNREVAPHVDNGTTRLLLWPHRLIPADDFIDPAHDDELFEEAVAVLDSFAYAGIVEDENFASDLGDWLGHPVSLQRLNGAGVRRQPDTVDLGTEVSGRGADLLRFRTRIDARLWRHLAARKFPAGQIDELAERTYERAVERYSEMLAHPARQPIRRRVVERSYSVATRLRGAGRHGTTVPRPAAQASSPRRLWASLARREWRLRRP